MIVPLMWSLGTPIVTYGLSYVPWLVAKLSLFIVAFGTGMEGRSHAPDVA